MADTVKELDDNSPMPFGMYRGKRMEEVPAQYLLWLFNKGCDNAPAMKKYIQDNFYILQKEAGQIR